jgi:hypothetical protein
MNNRKNKVLACVMMVLFSTGCPFPDAPYLKNKPQEADLVGIWKSIDGNETIEIKKDHSCIATGEIIFDPFNTIRFHNVKGKWSINFHKHSNFYTLLIYWDPQNKFQNMVLQDIDILDTLPLSLQLAKGDRDTGKTLKLLRVVD